MTDGYGTSTEEMGRAALHVLSVNEGVQNELSTLRLRLDPLIAAWAGDAAGQFVQLMQRWDTNARTLSTSLGAIGEAIQSSGQLYQAQEGQTSREISTITSALG